MGVNDDVLAEIRAELEKDRVYVHPTLDSQFTPAQLEELAAKSAEHDAYVVAYPFDRRDEFGGSPDDLLARLTDQHPAEGLYLSNQKLNPDGSTPFLEAVGQGHEASLVEYYVDYTVLSAVGYEQPADLGTAYVRAFEVLEMPRAEAKALREESYQTYRDENYWWLEDEKPGPDFLPGWALPAILAAVAATAVSAWIARRRRLAAPKPSVLPSSAIARIRDAHDLRLAQRARDEVQALGEAIDAAEIARGGDLTAWQAALDHYDAARRVLDGPDPDVLEVIGAIVLAERGAAALTAARAGRPWQPTRPCFLNPLHGEAPRQRAVSWEGTTVTAPLCSRCDDDLGKKRTPDILDVARRGQPVHYFESDSEPWSSTGYGALHDDLLERLHRR